MEGGLLNRAYSTSFGIYVEEASAPQPQRQLSSGNPCLAGNATLEQIERARAISSQATKQSSKPNRLTALPLLNKREDFPTPTTPVISNEEPEYFKLTELQDSKVPVKPVPKPRAKQSRDKAEQYTEYKSDIV